MTWGPVPEGRRGGQSRASRGLMLLAVLALCAAAVTGCGGGSAAVRADGDSGYVAGDGSTVLLPAAQRKPAPALSAPTLKDGRWDGPVFDLAAHKGEVVVLNVWASWCADCRVEAPALAQVSRDLKAQGVQFAGLSTRDTATAAQAFVDRFDVPYPTVDDTDGRQQLGFRDTGLPVLSVPTTIVIDKQGRVAARALGALDVSRVKGLVEPLLRESAG